MCIGVLFGCAAKPDTMQPAEVYFRDGIESIDALDYIQATENLEKLNAVHPFSEYAEQSLLELAWVYYANGDNERCRITLARFLRQHPESSQIDYAYYLRAITHYEDDRNFLHDSFGVDQARRSLQSSKLALQDFSYLVQRFPNSRYAQDSRSYIVHIHNLLARKELLVGEFYMQRGVYAAALNRALVVLTSYADANYTPNALALGARAYDNMGLAEQASNMRTKLATWYPDFTE